MWVDPLGLTEVTVGRWMGPAEYEKMVSTGKVVQSTTGTTHVASPQILMRLENKLSRVLCTLNSKCLNDL